MKKHFFYITKSLFLMLSISLIVLSEYGMPFKNRKGKNFLNEGKLWDAKALIPNSNPIVLTHKQKVNKAVLIAHDYAGTPNNVSELAQKLFNDNFDVFVPLLPGHGTNIYDFNKTTLNNWSDALIKAYNQIKSNYKSIIGIGVYTGGSIFLKQIIEKTVDFSALILINSPIMILGYTRGNFFLPDIKLFFSGILRHFKIDYPQYKISETELKNTNWLGYNGYSNLGHIHFIKINLRKVKKHCFKINIPLLLINNKNNIVPIENSNYIYEHVKSKVKKRIIIKNPTEKFINTIHIQLDNETKQKVFEHILKFLLRYK